MSTQTETPTRTAQDARLNWRDVLDEAQQGQATIVERYGKEVAVVIPWPTWKQQHEPEKQSVA